jgi:hypothetical protein
VNFSVVTEQGLELSTSTHATWIRYIYLIQLSSQCTYKLFTKFRITTVKCEVCLTQTRSVTVAPLALREATHQTHRLFEPFHDIFLTQHRGTDVAIGPI